MSFKNVLITHFSGIKTMNVAGLEELILQGLKFWQDSELFCKVANLTRL